MMEQDPPVSDTWLTFDGMVERDPNDPNKFILVKPLYYVYIRALYWSVGTSVITIIFVTVAIVSPL